MKSLMQIHLRLFRAHLLRYIKVRTDKEVQHAHYLDGNRLGSSLAKMSVTTKTIWWQRRQLEWATVALTFVTGNRRGPFHHFWICSNAGTAVPRRNSNLVPHDSRGVQRPSASYLRRHRLEVRCGHGFSYWRLSWFSSVISSKCCGIIFIWARTAFSNVVGKS
jgi:hypothetical protein